MCEGRKVSFVWLPRPLLPALGSPTPLLTTHFLGPPGPMLKSRELPGGAPGLLNQTRAPWDSRRPLLARGHLERLCLDSLGVWLDASPARAGKSSRVPSPPGRPTTSLSWGMGAAQGGPEGAVLSLREVWDMGQTLSLLSIQPIGGTRVNCSPTLKNLSCHLKIRRIHRSTLQIPSFFGKQ